VPLALGFGFVVARRSPKKLKSVPSDNVAQEETIHDQDRKLLYQAFYAGSDFQWMVGMNQDNKDDEDVIARHVQVCDYLINGVVTFAEKYGYVLVQRDEKGGYQGSICLVPPYGSWWLSTLQFLLSVIPLGKPVPIQMGGLVEKRFNAFIDALGKNHQGVMVTRDHWYIANLGVAETAQGKGVGSNLIKTALSVIQEHDTKGEAALPQCAYLECHDGNVPFYKKMGFSQEERFAMQETPPVDVSEPPYYYNSMVYRFD
jgi:ribosomal protein S18 acetylase RimI-like enzyme